MIQHHYMNWTDPWLVVERKNSLLELANCLGNDHERFLTELRNATNAGVHTVLLIEEDGFFELEDVKHWVNPNASKTKYAMTGDKMYKILTNYVNWYNFEIRFTSKGDSGNEILKILKAVG